MIMGLFATFLSCSDSDRNDEQPQLTDKEWYYKVEVSQGSTITNILYQSIVPSPPYWVDISVTDINGISWTSPVNEVRDSGTGPSPKIRVKATGLSDQSTLKVQFYLNGVLKAEKKDIGKILDVSLGN